MSRDHLFVVKRNGGINTFTAFVMVMALLLPNAGWAESREFNITIDEVKLHVAPEPASGII